MVAAPIPLSAVCHGQHLPDFAGSMASFKSAGATELTLFMDWRTAEEAAARGEQPVAIGRCIEALDEGFDVTLRLELHGQALHVASRPELAGLFDGETGFPLDLRELNDAQLIDTDGAETPQLNFFNNRLRGRVSQYIEKLDPFLGGLDRERVHVALAVSEQNEVKYGMRGYVLRGANPSILRQLDGVNRKRLRSFENRQPLDVPIEARPGLTAFHQLRTHALAAFCESVYGDLATRGFAVAGYFGRFLGPHDFVFGAPVIDQARRFCDRAIVDHNFFNGDRMVLDAEKIPTMTNYLRTNLGIEPAAGIYVEKTHTEKGRHASIGPARRRSLLRCVEYLFGHDAPVAFEVGGFRDDFYLFSEVIERMHAGLAAGSARAAPGRAIHILATHETFALFRDEKDSNREHRLERALNFAYRVIADDLGYAPRVIGADQLLAGTILDDPDAVLVIPLQLSLSDVLIGRLADARCKVFADLLPGRVTPDGAERLDTARAVFGIEAAQEFAANRLAAGPFSFAAEYDDPLFAQTEAVGGRSMKHAQTVGDGRGFGATYNNFFCAGLPLFLCDKHPTEVAKIVGDFVDGRAKTAKRPFVR